jgi:hypothetical protein
MKYVALTAAFVAFATTAQASTLTGADFQTCIGLTTCFLPGGVTASAVSAQTNAQGASIGGLLLTQDFEGVEGLGIGVSQTNSGVNGDPELRGSLGEVLTFMFSIPSYVTGFDLAHLYNPQAFSVDPQEIAFIDAFGSKGSARLKITNLGYSGNNAGRITNLSVMFENLVGVGSVTAMVSSPIFTGAVNPNNANSVNPGLVEVRDFFPELGPLTKLVFSADPTPKNNDGSDYSVAAIHFSPIPLPAAGWMMIAGIGALVAARRRAA